jgi:three-Cys-motif partner protein
MVHFGFILSSFNHALGGRMRKFGGTWSESKLDCVEAYTHRYLQVMQNQRWYSLDYVDAFAGRGKQALRKSSGSDAPEPESFFGDESERVDTQEFLVGSAIRALRASTSSTRSFDRFVFIDVDKPSCLELESIVLSDFHEIHDTVSVVCGNANAALGEYIEKVDWTHTRSLVFLDPYGLEVGWDLIMRLADTGACDVWYLFPLGGVIRMMTNDGQVPDTWRVRLDRVFGTNEWYDEFYRTSGQQSLFNDEASCRFKNASTDHVVDFIRKRLKTAFPAVSNAGILRNGKGVPLFALVLGVSNPSIAAQKAALGIANHLVKDLDQ